LVLCGPCDIENEMGISSAMNKLQNTSL
jgi:hypothetical protein